VLVAAVLGAIAGTLPAFLIGAVAPQAGPDLGFEEQGLGVLVAVPFGVAALTSALLGRLAERLGAARTLRLTGGAAAAGMLAISRAPTFGALAAGLAFAGCVNALAQPAANLYVARNVDPRRQGVAFGLKQSAIPAATMLAGLAVPTISLTVGWRWVFVAGAALAVVGAVLVPADGAPRVPLTARRPEGLQRARPDATLRPLLVLAVGMAFGSAAAGALGAFLVSAAVAAGIDPGPAGLLLTAGSVVGIVVRIFVGARADRRGSGHLRVVAFMQVGGAVAFALFALDLPATLVAATPLAFGMGWAWPGLFNFSIVRNNPSAPAAATGITQTGTYAGAMVGPLVFGTVVAASSYPVGWTVAASWFLVSAATMLVGRRLLLADRTPAGAAPRGPVRR
jgi:MFS family permease